LQRARIDTASANRVGEPRHGNDRPQNKRTSNPGADRKVFFIPLPGVVA
jgi:hypothetical protein